VRAYGGALLVQACLAASARSDPDARVRFASAHFLRSGNGGQSVDLGVRPISEGRTVVVQAVEARQDDSLLMTAQVSLEARASTVDRVRTQAPPSIADARPGPQWPGVGDHEQTRMRRFEERHAWDILFGSPPVVRGEGGPSEQWLWARPRVPAEGVRDELASLLIMYASDMYTPGIAAATVGGFLGTDVTALTIAHAVSVTHAYRPGEWIAIHHACQGLSGGRGSVHSTYRSEDGTLLGESLQEVLVRTISGP